MKICMICIGTELLNGHTVNTNLAVMASALDERGYRVDREVCVPDTHADIVASLRDELRAADLVVTVGGLGPTCDDITRPAVAEVLGVRLYRDAAVYRHIEEYLQRRNVPVRCDSLEIQAMVPDGATALPNRNGTAPGLWCPAAGGRVVVMLPGPPRELGPMFVDQVLPKIAELAPATLARRTVHVCGVPESLVEERVARAIAGIDGLEQAYCARPMMVDASLTAPAVAAARLDEAEARVRAEFASAALAPGEDSLVASIGGMLRRRGWTLATAESCTGGGVAEALTAEPGASDFFVGSLVCYANAWKERFLGVKAETLAKYGAVSEETAAEMLAGLLERTGADAGIAVTGIAGPSGGTAEKPVGLVYIAVGAGDRRRVYRRMFPGSRATTRERATAFALILLRTELIEALGQPTAQTEVTR